jgi:hypothetical protein
MRNKIFTAALLAFCSPLFAVEDIDGKDWSQPNLFTGLSWSDISAVCNPGTGVCEGNLNGIDVTGKTWASVDDVNGLFNSFLPLAAQLGPGPATSTESNSRGAPEFHSFFAPTLSYNSLRSVSGITRTLAPLASAWHGTAQHSFGDNINGAFTTALADTRSRASPEIGVWLYTTPSVP